MPEDEEYIDAAVRLWEKPRESENTLLVQRTGFDGPANGIPTVDRVSGGAWVMAWVYIEDDVVRDG